MKELIQIRSNALYLQPEGGDEFVLRPALELVLIHTDGKKYRIDNDGQMEEARKLSETRLIISPRMFEFLLEQVSNHQKKMAAVEINAKALQEAGNLLRDPE